MKFDFKIYFEDDFFTLLFQFKSGGQFLEKIRIHFLNEKMVDKPMDFADWKVIKKRFFYWIQSMSIYKLS